jgi:hypothetical protein
MTHPLRPISSACLLALLIGAGCASDKPCTNQDLTVAAPVYSAALYQGCNGRTVRVTAHMRPHGSRVESLRVVLTNKDGAVAAEAPSVRNVTGANVQAITTDGSSTVIWFNGPGPRDGNCVTMTVTVPSTGPCPYRIRLVPVFKAG